MCSMQPATLVCRRSCCMRTALCCVSNGVNFPRRWHPVSDAYTAMPSLHADWLNVTCCLNCFRDTLVYFRGHSLRYSHSTCNINKNPTRCISMQIFIYFKISLHVSGVTAPIRSTVIPRLTKTIRSGIIR